MSATPLSLAAYYATLLIMQYSQKPKASATVQALAGMAICPQVSVQTISFGSAPASGSFVLTYGSLTPVTVAWNESAASVQAALQALPGLSSVTVAGRIASLALTVTFTGVPPIAPLLAVSSNATGVTITVAETDVTLPLAIQNAFNLTGPSVATGSQLNILAEYVGAARSGYGTAGYTTLSDSDFLQLIRFATAVNNSFSSLANIQAAIASTFPGEVLIYDYANMQMSYLVNSSIGSQNLIQLAINQGFFPKPMGVQLGTIVYYSPINAFFGFRTYGQAAYNSSPFNDYASYQTAWPWLSYQNVLAATYQLTDESGTLLTCEDGTNLLIN